MMNKVDQSRFMIFSSLLIIIGTIPTHAIHNQKYNNPILSLPLHPRTRNQTARIISDIARVNYLNSKRRNTTDSNNNEVDLLGVNGGYEAQILVGQPSSEFMLLVDTGSNVIWVKCSTCSKCSNPTFDPSKSTSFKKYNCTSLQCNLLQGDETRCPDGIFGGCGFQSYYQDGATVIGDFITETLSFGSSGPLENIGIGCALEVSESGPELDGIIGLGAGSASITRQINSTSFSYCLTPNIESESSTLDFNSLAPSDSVVARMFRDINADDFYYVELTGITIGEVHIQVPPEVYRIGEDGSGGVIVDSGSTLTYLDAGVYKIFLEAFQNHTQALQLVSSPTLGLLPPDVCYNVTDLSDFHGPAISFQFSNISSLDLEPINYMIEMDNDKYCLAIQPNEEKLSIIGNVAQIGMRVTYDLEKSQINFSPKKC